MIGSLAEKAATLDNNFVKAMKSLKQAEALSGLNAYERSTIYQMMGMYSYELDDITGAIAYHRKAITAGGLLAQEQQKLESHIAQLLIANGQYLAGAEALERHIEQAGDDNPKYAQYIMQAYVQAEAYENALPYAQKWFDNAESKERKHYDLMNFLFNDLEMRAEQIDHVEKMIIQWPQDKELWNMKISLLAMEGREKEAYFVHEEMYERGLSVSDRELIKLAEYHIYYKYHGKAYSLLVKELAAGRIEGNSKSFDLLQKSRSLR